MTEDRQDEALIAQFEPHRRYLRGLAYRLLGSVAEAEDIVQDAYLRWHDAVHRDGIKDPRAFLARTVTRLCLDRLKSAKARREVYVGTWLPEPVLDQEEFDPDPMAASDIAHDLSVALMLTLERLSPLERAAFILHDVFDAPFAEVATTLRRSEATCRQLASRARLHVRESQSRFRVSAEEVARLAAAFADALRTDDRAALSRLFAKDVVFVADGGGKARAINRPLSGAGPVAKLVWGFARLLAKQPGITMRPALVNGLPGIVLLHEGVPVQTMACELGAAGLVSAIYVIRNPDKLRHIN